MSKVVVSEFVSLDGVMQDPAGNEGSGLGAWSFQFDRGPGRGQVQAGRGAGERGAAPGACDLSGLCRAWPSRTDDVGFADKMNGMPKFVVSTTTLGEVESSNFRLINDNITRRSHQAEGAARWRHSDLRQRPTRQYADGTRPRGRVPADGLSDSVGRGKRLFRDGSVPTALRLKEAEPLGPNGVLILTYEPAGREEEAAGA